MSKDTIDRQAAIEAIESITSSMSVCINKDECYGMKRMQQQAVNELANLPSAQSECKTGKWTRVVDRHGINGESVWKCSSCLKMTICKGNFCPNCGADMRGEE